MPAKKKTTVGGPPKRGDRAFQLKKTVNRDSGRRPAPGERRALRKRIVLSNTNALDVPGLQDMAAENIASAELEKQVVGLPGPVVDSLRAVEAFKTTQGWSLFRRPAALMRKESVDMGKLVEEISSSDGSGTARRVIVAKELTIGHTDYSPLANTDPTQYVQKAYTATLLSQISKANKEVLSKLQLSSKPNVPIPVQENISLDRFADLGARDPDIAWPVFQALWAELTQPSKPEKDGFARPAVLLCLDSLGHVMRDSSYLDGDVKPIHAHDLLMVRHFVDHLSGARTLPNGGMVLAAHSESNKPACPALEFAVEQNEARAAGHEVPQWDPYKVVDRRVLQAMKEVEVVRLQGLSREEARGIMEYYAASGMLRSTVSDGLVSEKWTLAGGGIVGELERNSVRMRI